MAAVQSSPAPILSPLLMEYDAGPSTRSPQPPAQKRARVEVASPPTPVKRVVKSRSRSATPAERRYKCQYDGCDKAYTKPSRLAEHELSHTGERRHACPQCSQTYLRATHLHSHLRTHLSEEERPFACEKEDCGKKFWTAAHLKRHMDVHDQAKVYQCEECSESFVKGHLLRVHALTHMPPGTKPFPCPHEGCDWSFAMKQQLKAHEKTHEANRYTCSHPSHDIQPSFDKWSLLQSHIKNDHPPICPHEECGGRVFKNAQRLKDHLKVHEQRAEDLQALAEKVVDSDAEEEDEHQRKRKRRRSQAFEDGGKSPKLKPIRSGEAGKDFACPEPGCEKRFKAANSLKTHHKVVHLKIKSHVCPIENCGKAFAHMCNLNQHLKAHTRAISPIATFTPHAISEESRLLTGDIMTDKRFGCPAHRVIQGEFERFNPCHLRFWRVYDVKRHLKADHGLDLEDGEVRALLGDGFQADVDGPEGQELGTGGGQGLEGQHSGAGCEVGQWGDASERPMDEVKEESMDQARA